MNLANVSRLRQGVYRLAGAGFAYPSDELIAAAAGTVKVLEPLGLFEFSFGPAVATAVETLAVADMDTLTAAYVSLFEAGVGGAACPAQESGHLGDARTGDVAKLQAELRQTYSSYGLTVGGVAAVDHISTEMHVMALLCAQEAECHISGRPFAEVVNNQANFLTAHVLRWVPGFATMVESAQRHPAYSALSAATRAFIIHERQLIPMLLDTSRERVQ